MVWWYDGLMVHDDLKMNFFFLCLINVILVRGR
jgi:hypothetical protein